jgi:hypothetical protein
MLALGCCRWRLVGGVLVSPTCHRRLPANHSIRLMLAALLRSARDGAGWGGDSLPEMAGTAPT